MWPWKPGQARLAVVDGAVGRGLVQEDLGTQRRVGQRVRLHPDRDEPGTEGASSASGTVKCWPSIL